MSISNNSSDPRLSNHNETTNNAPGVLAWMTSHKNIRNIAGKLFTIAVTVIACMVILEVGLRIMGRVPSNITDGIFEQSGDSYRLRKNIFKVSRWPSFTFTTYTNSLGFRDKETGDRNITDIPYFLFLGDSLVFANGVDYEDSFAGIFADLTVNNNIEVLNMGIGGHHIADQEKLLIDFTRGLAKKPSKIFFFVDPVFISTFDSDSRNIIVKNGYLFDRRSWKLAFIRLTLSNMSSAYCFFRDNMRLLQAKWIHMNIGEGDVPPYLSLYSRHNRMRDRDIIVRFEARLNEIERYCQNMGSEIIYVYLPFADSYSFYTLLDQLGEDRKDYDVMFYVKLMEDYCKKKNIRFINLKPVLQTHYNEGKILRYKTDPHYNTFANRVVGEFLYDQIFPGKNKN